MTQHNPQPVANQIEDFRGEDPLMKNFGLEFLLTVLAILAVSPLAIASSEAAERLIERGDRFFDKREKGRKWVDRAVGCYEKALAVDSQSVEASWKYAQAALWVSAHTEDEEEQIRLIRQSIDVTRRAIQIDEQSVAAHYWLGIGFAKYGEAKGVMNALGLVDPLRRQMRRVIELDESFAGGGAWRILGWINYKLPGVAGGSDEKAVEQLEKSRELDPSHLLTHLCLAEIYRLDDLPKKARWHLDFIINAPFNKERKPEEIEIKAAAKEMREKLP